MNTYQATSRAALFLIVIIFSLLHLSISTGPSSLSVIDMLSLYVGESLTNLVWAKVTLSDVKASGYWMYAAKLEGEGSEMYDAGIALSEAMIQLGIAINCEKDKSFTESSRKPCDQFRGIGGFSYPDVVDSAKRWAASVRFNSPLLRQQLQEFYKRPDTFSLILKGVSLCGSPRY